MAEMDMDDQELAERQEAATAYAAEDEKLYLDWIEDCVDTSAKARRDIRQTQKELWAMYQEDEPDAYAAKEEWQARIVIPKPYAAVKFATASIKKAFSPDFLSIRDARDERAAAFWRKVMEIQLDELHAQFVLKFVDAVEMSLAIGESLEMIPHFANGRLSFELVEPWKIYRDPDAPPRDPQAGLYWIHREWVDKHVLRQGEEAGRYTGIDRLSSDGATDSIDDRFMDPEAVARRKGQTWEQGTFRKKYLVSEFYGAILDKKGEILLPQANMTAAAGVLIQPPKAVDYRDLRWPGIGFSPLPNLLSSGGRGILQGVKTIWQAMNNMICMHEDALKWVVMPPMEINVDALTDPEDVECWPGKKYLVRDTPNGQQAIRSLQFRDNTNSILANMQSHDQYFQRGSFVSDIVQGLPGYRDRQTYRESAMQLDNALGVFSLMGANVEQGAIAALSAARSVIQTYATAQDYMHMLGEEFLARLGLALADTEAGVAGLPEMSGAFRVSGVQALLKDQETLEHLTKIVVPLAGDPTFGPFIRPFGVLRAIETRTNMGDENVFLDQKQGEELEVGLMAQRIATATGAGMGLGMGAPTEAGAPGAAQGGMAPDNSVLKAMAGGRKGFTQ